MTHVSIWADFSGKRSLTHRWNRGMQPVLRHMPTTIISHVDVINLFVRPIERAMPEPQRGRQNTVFRGLPCRP